ncbi:nucleoside hydrolase [Streptomyces clavuligerus]|uniref:Inosine-uridine preferring nucleoside hydrolase n=1 Tax=Streptomyces clavuligerus TaxID=1901 RepID=E2Q656_STRCL|nr:nucleoside hydrolase [Streptomyces clavuligerus]ANW21611.1 ribonucleoside hydrolase [Streptomyces clavuligerus]AXU16237.1 nucleoside hydrolase [Streptomyces clavuligerus]EFG05216.1 Inosine-uridine preferring nucleoside hydrolase [Streptomyces clavuligerus]MBY6306395.1 nucleoside hydrolase [Streptomyces clavuligerus]QCS09017.1 nucleoside hydrolase [Streptomyces clavuligerus]
MRRDTPVPIVLDCDPGHDDAIALLLAAGDPAVDLLAITTVAGNQTVEKTTLNALRVCTVAGITDVPVAAGCARPLVRAPIVAGDVHGESGLDGPRFGEPRVRAVPEHAVELTRRVLTEHPEPVTLVPTGPLTNIALLLTRYPECASSIREIVLMGGSAGRGNRTPAAEFNILADPEAADIVFRSGLPVTMCGLDVTHQALATDEVVARLAALGTEPARMCVELIAFFADTYRRLWGFPCPPVHDPVAVARVADPSIVRCVDAHVVVELRGEYTRGATVVDLDGFPDRPVNARVAMELDSGRFWDRVIAAVERLGRRGPAA